ncbi:hypothetical protein ACHAQH_005972 [Verticillium albo-atrum]
MAKKKKNKQTATEGSGTHGSNNVDEIPSPAATSSTRQATSSVDNGPALIISRNKHWRFISSFHGPWLQLPIEMLETMANLNYNTPRPRPIDPAVFFDLLKIRRLVDEATNLAVRAASDIASPTLTNVHGGMNGHAASSLGFGVAGHGAKLSRERKFRMREQASQKLARAYRLDEIACSVASMQGASTLEDIGSLVLQRNPDDPDAKYVHFFHEKIPSRQMAESTSLVPLGEIIESRPTDAETWRTRATVRVFKEDFEGAAMDLTQALQVHRFHRPYQGAAATESVLANVKRHDVVLTDEQQPSSLETQLLFQRAGVYLALACQHIFDALPDTPVSGKQDTAGAVSGEHGRDDDVADKPHEPSLAEKEALRRALEHRKLVKTYAKRALRDYMSYLSRLDYAPYLPPKVLREFTEKINMSVQGNRHPRIYDSGVPTPGHTTHTLADLFTAVPPSDIPPYPSQEAKQGAAPSPSAVNEAITYHPLLTDGLHSLLLCHCLVQTSAKELLRHAHMVARIIRLAEGYPIFQAARSPARADWLEVVRRANNWIQLASSWDDLCEPAPFVFLGDQPASGSKTCRPSPDLAARAAAAIARDGRSPSSNAEHDDRQRLERIRQQAIMESLEDDRVIDEATFRAAVTARQKRAEEDHALLHGANENESRNGDDDGTPALVQGDAHASQQLHRWSADDGNEYPILSDRAAAVARWVLHAPVGAGGTRRKKKGGVARKGAKVPAGEPEGVAAGMEKLAVRDGTED